MPEELADEEKLRFIASKISIWYFFGLPQANYLALSKGEKSRMCKDYYKKLVLKYFSDKNIFLSFFLNCLRPMFEISALSSVCVLISFFWLFFLGNEAKSTEIDSSISHAVRNSNKISMTKNIFEGSAEITLTVEKFISFKRNTTDVWKNYGYFKQQPCDFSIEKANLPENTIVYINEANQSYKDNKRVYYVDYYLLGQVNQCLNPSEDLKNYEYQPNEAKFYRPKYDTVTGEFLGLYETLGFLTVRGDNQECFFDYGYSKDNSKVL